MMFVRAAFVYLSSKVFLYEIIDYEAAFVYPLFFSVTIFLSLVVVRFFERRMK